MTKKTKLINRLTLSVQSSIIEEVDNRLFTNNTTDIYLRKDATYALLIHLLSLFTRSEKSSKVFNFNITSLRNTFKRPTDIYGNRFYEAEYMMEVLDKHNIVKKFSTGNSFSHKNSEYYFTDNFIEAIAVNQAKETTITITDSKYIQTLFNQEIQHECKQQWKFLNDKDLTIDINGAFNKLYEMLQSKEIDMNKYLRHITNITNFKMKSNLWIVMDNNTGRIYSTFTNLKRELRQFITYKNKPLQSIDLKSAHPYLLASILKDKNEDCMKFYNTVVNDDIYNWGVNNATNYNYNGELTRQNFKVEMMYAIYKPTMKCNSIYLKMFKSEFNGFYNELSKLKDKDNTLNLAQYLQNKEAELFIPVANKFKNCLSLHDGIYFIEEDKENIIKELKMMFAYNNLKNYTLDYEK